ncbi:MAG: C4-dicarboxylate ABC transporter permease [Paracoccaceae bacterium]|nr:C4-dicarboxylate ABC transporter permease [Paracoccaceae bacterium]MDE2914610.1 C4-dicarboxylate ABC transporter permease [Paracoccaceae bacterium]
MFDLVVGVVQNLFLAFYNFGYAVSHPADWLNWSDSTALVRFIYYGASSEFFYVVVATFIVVTAIGLWRRRFLWGVVAVMEGFSNGVGRVFAWAGLIMVLQQIVIVFLQRIFRVSEISIGPFGYVVTKDLSWYAEELKLYNAIIVCLCCAYTFVQGGHVRVDLFYAGVRFRTKRIIDMFGSLFFIVPVMAIVWMYGWFFLWRHLVTPKISASDKLELLERKARLLKWNVETIGFSPNGFNGYFLFKVLLVGFAGMMFIQGVAYFYRSLLEFIEGEGSANRNLDRDSAAETDALASAGQASGAPAGST